MTDADLSRALALLDAKPQGDGSWRGWCPVHQPGGDRGGRNLAVLPADWDQFPTFVCDKECGWPELRRALAELGVARSLLRGAAGKPDGLADGPREPPVPVPDEERLQVWQANLLDGANGWDEDRQSFLDYLRSECGLSDEQMRAEGIGLWNGLLADGTSYGPSLTVPYRYTVGQVVALRLWNPVHPDKSKRKRWLRGHGAKHLLGAHKVESWPPDAPVLFCEGEGDYLAATAVGLHAVAAPGAGIVPDNLGVLAGRRVVVCYDNDDTGRIRAHKLAEALASAGAAAFVADIGQHLRHKGADVRDWFVHSNLPLQQFRDFLGAAAAWDPLAVDVENRAARLRVERRARALIDGEGWERPASYGTAADELDEDLPEPVYVVDQLVPEGANVLVAAQAKAGKTTLALNLARALVDENSFVQHYDTALPAGSVGFWNAELDRRTAIRWVREMKFQNPDRLSLLHLRGLSCPMTSPSVQDWAVGWLRDNGVVVWIVDPFGALFTGDENSNSEVRDWLRALDSVKRRAGVDVLVLVTHTGHVAEDDQDPRARGASRLLDWPDVRWSFGPLTRGQSRRFLVAHGRDVDVPEFSLDYESSTRSLSWCGGETRRHARVERLVGRVVEYVAEQFADTAKPLSMSAIERGVRANRERVREATEAAVALGYVRREEGPNRSKLHYPGEQVIRAGGS